MSMICVVKVMLKKFVLHFCACKMHVKRNSLLFVLGMLLIFSMSSCLSEKEQTYEDYTENFATSDSFTKDFYSNVSISIIEIESDTSTGTVKVVIPNLKAIYLNHRDEFSDSLTEDQIHGILLQNLHEFVIEHSFDTDLYKDGREWKLASTEQVDILIAEMVDSYLDAVLADIEFSSITIDVSMEDILK